MKSLYKNIKIPALEGAETIADSKLFVYIDSDFKNWGLDKKGVPTKKSNFEVFELDKDMTFKEMFTQPEEQWMTQSQILTFIKENRDKLRQGGYATFFLLKKDDEFFVADVCVVSAGLRVFVCRFGRDSVWFAAGQHRVVVPQLDSESLSPSPLDTQSLCPLAEAIKICEAHGMTVSPWKPKQNEKYWIVTNDGKTEPRYWKDGSVRDLARLAFKNVFFSESEAKEKLEKIKEI